MAKNAIAEVESKIKKILEDKAAEVIDIEERVTAAKQQQRTADEAMTAAAATGDANAYRKAKADRRDAEDDIEMYNKRLDALKRKALISNSEYERGAVQILTALGEITADAKKRVIEHMEQIRIIAEECSAEIAKGNKVLHQWQHDVYGDAAETTVGNGKRVHLDSLERRFNDFSVSQFAEFVLDSGYYKTLSGRSE